MYDAIYVCVCVWTEDTRFLLFLDGELREEELRACTGYVTTAGSDVPRPLLLLLLPSELLLLMLLLLRLLDEVHETVGLPMGPAELVPCAASASFSI